MLDHNIQSTVQSVQLLHIQPADGVGTKFGKKVAAASIPGVVSLAFTSWFDQIKMRKILGLKRKQCDLSSIYRGFGTSCLGIAVYRGLYFGLYDTARTMLP